MIDHNEMIMPKEAEVKERPIATDQDVKYGMRDKINAVRRSVEAPIRLGSSTFGNGNFIDKASYAALFTVTSKGAFPSGLYGEDGNWLRKVEPDRMQTLALEVMKEYGFDPDSSIPAEYAMGHIKTKDGIVNYPDGKSEEFKLYPSKTIEGLVFRRSRKYDTATGKTFSVSWEVLDRAPSFRINLGNKSRQSA